MPGSYESEIRDGQLWTPDPLEDEKDEPASSPTGSLSLQEDNQNKPNLQSPVVGSNLSSSKKRGLGHVVRIGGCLLAGGLVAKLTDGFISNPDYFPSLHYMRTEDILVRVGCDTAMGILGFGIFQGIYFRIQDYLSGESTDCADSRSVDEKEEERWEAYGRNH